MNDHPHDLLAEYVDGALGPEQRASVEAHLASCPACRQEVAMAGQSRNALAALPEVPAPAGVALRVRRQARRPSRTSRWIAAAAAAAVLAGAGAIVVTRALVGGQAEMGAAGGGAQGAPGPSGPAAEDGERTRTSEPQALGAEAAADARAVVYLESDRDYDPAALAKLAPRLRAQATSALRRGFAQTTQRFFDELRLDTVPPAARRAVRCASEGLPPDQPATPFRIEAARFQGEPVYVAAFLRGPSPEARHDRLLLWVVTREGCDLRYFAAQRL
jgi:hypothetical protein